MLVTKRILITLITLVSMSTGAWALSQDTDGYYLIGSLQDWKDFANLVNTQYPGKKDARMTADIDLGTDQTMLGRGTDPNTYYYLGEFDGQGHTLTIAYQGELGYQFYAAPFRHASLCEIRNLNVKGTISVYNNIYQIYVGGIVGYSTSTCKIKNCHVDVDFISPAAAQFNINYSSLVGCASSNAIISDCMVEGSVKGKDGISTYYSPFIGLITFINSSTPSSITNSLSTATTENVSLVTGAFRTVEGPSTGMTNVYSRYVGASKEQQCIAWTEEQLTNGYIAYKLQNGRSNLVWGQKIGTDATPIFTTTESKRVYRATNGFTNISTQASSGIKRDTEGYYLIDDCLDWEDFANIAENTPTAKARMIADVDLGYTQTKVGVTNPFQGIFDGQGHILTVHYLPSTINSSPFPQTANGAVIKNLCFAGTLENTSSNRPALVSIHNNGILNIEKVWSSVDITSTITDWDESAAFVACCNGTIYINDCMFTGSITSSGEEAGCFVGGVHGTVNITNSLSTGRFTLTGNNPGLRGIYSNTYILRFPPAAISPEMQCTTSELSNGTIITKLQAGRSERIWVQDAETGLPSLKIFANSPSITTGIDRGKLFDGDITGWYTINGQKLSGKPTKKGVYIINGKKAIVD